MKITESEIRKIVKDTLNELSSSQKKKNEKNVKDFFLNSKSGYNGIKTIVTFTADNPDSTPATNKYNKKAGDSLLQDIKSGGYAYVPARGKFGSAERSFAVFNMSVVTAKMLMGKYQQTSFIYSVLDGGLIRNEYWQKADPTKPYNKRTNDYVIKDTEDTIEDKTNADDGYTIIGKNFKYSIPFSIFNECRELFNKNLKHIVEQEKEKGILLTENKVLDFTINKVGQCPYLWRKAIIKDFYKD